MCHDEMFAVIKALLLMTLSFFTLCTADKATSDRLKKFGRVLAITMWMVAAYLVSANIYRIYAGMKQRTYLPYAKNASTSCSSCMSHGDKHYTLHLKKAPE